MWCPHVLWSAESNPCDARNPFQTQGKESLSSFPLSAGLDLVQCGLGGGILLLVGMIVVVVMVMIMVMIMVVVVVVVDLLDGRRHLSPSTQVLVNPSKKSRRTQPKPGQALGISSLLGPVSVREGDGIAGRVV